MPNKPAAAKYLRRSKKVAAQNALVKSRIKAVLRKCRKNIEVGKLDELQENVKVAVTRIDKAVQKGILKKNTAARKKSRLMKKVNAALKQS